MTRTYNQPIWLIEYFNPLSPVVGEKGETLNEAIKKGGSFEDKLLELKEAHKEGRPIRLKGIVQRADQKNQNGRIYPFDILSPEVDRYKNENVKQKCALGELDHREEPVIHLDRASHITEDLWWEGKDLWGQVRLLNTPKGKVAQGLVLEDGIAPGISSRAIGSVSQNESEGADVVQEDLNLVCWDLVSQPSTHGAWLGLQEAKAVDARQITEAKNPPKTKAFQILSELLNKEE